MASTPVQPQFIASTGNRSLSNALLIENPESDQIVVPDVSTIRYFCGCLLGSEFILWFSYVCFD